MNPNLRAAIPELIGTFAVVLLTSGVVVASGLAEPGIRPLTIAVAAGCSYAAALAFTVRLSGGFLNPAITITLWVFQRIENRRAIWFLIAQCVGTLLAGLVLRGQFFINENLLLETRLGTPHLNAKAFDVLGVDRSSVFLGISIEAVLTFVLVFAIFLLIFDPRFRKAAGDVPYRLSYLWLGLLVAAETLLAQSYTGASLNPARWLGGVIWESTVSGLQSREPWSDHGPYWIGPLLGSVLAGMLYTYVIAPPEARKGSPTDGMP